MADQGGALAPANPLHQTAAQWLHDAAYAADMARLHLDQTRLALRVIDFSPTRPPRGGSASLGLESPTWLVRHRHRNALREVDRAAYDSYRDAVGWYAWGATLALEAVLAGGAVTAAELEAHTIRRIHPDGALVVRGEPWVDGRRPRLRPPAALATGHPDLDQPLAAAYEPLAAAYRAADLVAAREDGLTGPADGYVADWGSVPIDDADALAGQVWTLLHRWADVVAAAAWYGRSPVRGHESV